MLNGPGHSGSPINGWGRLLGLVGVPGERRNLCEERVVQLPRARAGGQPERDTKRLAPWTAGAQPAGGGPPDPPLQQRV